MRKVAVKRLLRDFLGVRPVDIWEEHEGGKSTMVVILNDKDGPKAGAVEKMVRDFIKEWGYSGDVDVCLEIL